MVSTGANHNVELLLLQSQQICNECKLSIHDPSCHSIRFLTLVYVSRSPEMIQPETSRRQTRQSGPWIYLHLPQWSPLSLSPQLQLPPFVNGDCCVRGPFWCVLECASAPVPQISSGERRSSRTFRLIAHHRLRPYLYRDQFPQGEAHPRPQCRAHSTTSLRRRTRSQTLATTGPCRRPSCLLPLLSHDRRSASSTPRRRPKMTATQAGRRRRAQR